MDSTSRLGLARPLAVALLAAALTWSAAAQSRATLETKVTARGDQILLKWGKKHPWDAELQARGAFLLVEYRTANGAVGIDCLKQAATPSGARRVTRRALAAPGCAGIAGEPDGEHERTRRFLLPDRLTAAPVGNVCLYFQLPNRRILPLRRAQNGVETARFHYQPWSERMATQSRIGALEARRDALARAVAVQAEQVTLSEARNARNGWESESACQGIPAPELEKVEATRPLAPPAEQDEVARRVCTMRVVNADRIVEELLRAGKLKGEERAVKIGTGLVHGPVTLDYLFSLLPKAGDDPNLAARRAQAQEFRSDWTRWSPRVEEYKKAVRQGGYTEPHFGDFDDFLYLQTITDTVGKVIKVALGQKTSIPPSLVAGYIGGTLEAYTRCVADGKTQLKIARSAATDLRARSPQLQEAARQQFVRACQAGLTTLETLRSELASLRQQLAHVESELSAMATADGGTALPEKETELNGAACVP